MPHSHLPQTHLSQLEVKSISEPPHFGEMQALRRIRRKGRQTVTHQTENIGIKQHRQLSAHHISTNQHGIYQVKITPPLLLRISGHTRSHYFVALKTDELQYAISRAKAVRLQAKCFFKNTPHDLPDSPSLSQQLLVQIHLMAKHFPVLRAYKHKPTTDDFPTLPPLDLSNAEEDIRFPYLNWLSELMEERAQSGMPRFRLNQITDYRLQITFIIFYASLTTTTPAAMKGYTYRRETFVNIVRHFANRTYATKSKNNVLTPFVFTSAG
ncbi:TPA: hypothetical protein ACPJ0R_004373 [Vibrio diabolicus]